MSRYDTVIQKCIISHRKLKKFAKKITSRRDNEQIVTFNSSLKTYEEDGIVS